MARQQPPRPPKGTETNDERERGTKRNNGTKDEEGEKREERERQEKGEKREERERREEGEKRGERERRDDDTKRRGSTENAIHLPAREVFTVIRNSRRRRTIAYLAARTACSVGEVAKAIAAIEHGIPTAHVTDRQRKCVYVSLLQIHLPKLADADVIEWNETEGEIERKRSVDALSGLVSCIDRACTDAGAV